jgi:hypothetical protein
VARRARHPTEAEACLKPWKIYAAAFLGYLALAGLIFHRLLPQLATHIPADDVAPLISGQSDGYNYLWTYWWAGRAPLSHLFHCDWVLPPAGADLRFHTHVLLPALLTWPLGKLFGPVAGYNLMLLLLLAGGALAMFFVLRRVGGVSTRIAFAAGALFGFAPYFLFKVHCHPSLVGACFWATALGFLLDGLVRGRWTRANAVGFTLAFWATFWNSFVEFYMLALACAALVLVLVRKSDLKGLARLFYWVAPGSVGLAFFWSAREMTDVGLARLAGSQAIFAFPRLSWLVSYSWQPRAPEYWGFYLPFSLVALAAVGFIARKGATKEKLTKLRLGALIALFLVICLDLSGAPSAILRALPAGGGFRFFSRFFPFALFFIVWAAAWGLEAISRAPRPWGRVALAVTTIACVLEFWATPHLSPVRDLALPNDLHAAITRAHPLLLVAPGFMQVHDTYQVALDVPMVEIAQLAREDPAAVRARFAAFPRVYGLRGAVPDPSWRLELEKLGVRHLLFERESDLERARGVGLPLTDRFHAPTGEILVELEAPATDAR